MAGPELTPLQIYEQFIEAHPQYKKASISQVGSIMIEQKLLTEAEVKELSKPLFDGFFQANNESDYLSFSAYESLGVRFTNNKNDKPSNYVEKPKVYHSVVDKLELTSSGKVDLNDYTLKGLKERYPEGEYLIDKPQENFMVVKDSSGKVFLVVGDTPTGKSINFVYPPAEDRGVFVDKLGEITSCYINSSIDGKFISKIYNNGDRYPFRVVESQDGSRLMTNIDPKTGKKTYEDYWEDGANMPSWSTYYTDGKPYKKVAGKITQHVLVDDLLNDVSAKNKLGLPTTRASLSDNVLKRITYENVEEVLAEYKDLTGRELIEDINDEIGLAPTLRRKLIHHIEKNYCKAAPDPVAGVYLARQLYDDIQGIGSGDLEQHLGMITPSNLKYVLVEYRRLSCEDQFEMYLNLTDINNVLYDVIGVDVSSEDIEKISFKLEPVEGLLTAISEERGLSEKTRNNLIKQIVDTMLDDKAMSVQRRTIKDITTHPEDYHKVEVDLYRAENSSYGDLRNPKFDKPNELNARNKTFDGQISQGLTGDCWLLAALNSVIDKPEVLAKLEELVKFDSKTGDYIVTMSEPKKEYRVTRDDLNNYTALSVGSEKVNAIEIAMDKLIRDNAYQRDADNFYVDDDFKFIQNVTIDGNFSTFFWRTMFGLDGVLYSGVDPKTEDFNTPGRVYAMSLREDNNTQVFAKSEKDPKYDFIPRHAYSIIGSDSENIYILNPWDSSDTITISRQEFLKLGADIEAYDVFKTASIPDQGMSQ